MAINYPILSKEEIAKWLQSIKHPKGIQAPKGDSITLRQVGDFLGVANATMAYASLGQCSELLQHRISKVYYMWMSGQVVFIKGHKQWTTIYPEHPVPRKIDERATKTCIKIVDGKPSIVYAKEERA